MQARLSSRTPAFTAVRPVRCIVSRSTAVVVRSSAVSAPAMLPVKSVEGEDKGTQQMALKVAGESGKGLVHRYLVMVQQNARQGNASTKTRMEVRGGGKKPYAQKGTGNARRGSSVSPLFVGGGITFGPKPKDYSIKMNKKERRLAMATAFQSAAADLMVVESLAEEVMDKKTKSLLTVLSKLGLNSEKKTLLILKSPHEQIMMAGGNIEKLKINVADKISIFDVLNADKIVIERDALAHVQEFFGGDRKEAATA
ncbi:MAG: hypothetical protein WDW36_007236 [Sanguina aurantia]